MEILFAITAAVLFVVLVLYIHNAIEFNKLKKSRDSWRDLCLGQKEIADEALRIGEIKTSTIGKILDIQGNYVAAAMKEDDKATRNAILLSIETDTNHVMHETKEAIEKGPKND